MVKHCGVTGGGTSAVSYAAQTRVQVPPPQLQREMNYVQATDYGFKNIPLTDVVEIRSEQRAGYFDCGWQVRVSYRIGAPIIVPCQSKEEAIHLVQQLRQKLEAV